MYYSCFSRIRRVASVFLLAALIFTLLVPSVFATPAEDEPPITAIPGPVTGWVDLQAKVPAGFTGSVTVQVQKLEDDSVYEISSYVVNDFKNSVEIPLGTYSVLAVYTSEDPFLYDVMCGTTGFTLESSFSLNVTVKRNEAGAAFLEGGVDMPEDPLDAPPVEEIVPPEEDPPVTVAPEEPTPEDVPPVEQEPDVSVPEDTQETEPGEETEKPSFVRSLLMGVIGTLFFAGVFVGIVYLVRRKYQ